MKPSATAHEIDTNEMEQFILNYDEKAWETDSPRVIIAKTWAAATSAKIKELEEYKFMYEGLCK